MEKKKKYIIIVIFAVIGMIIGVTSSLYTWISSNTDVILTIGGVTVNYESGTDITGIKLRPVLDKETGVENNYAIKKSITVSSSKETYFSLYMNAEIFDEGLKHESFKWEIYNDGLLLSMGNLRDINEKDRITLINNLKINNMINNLELYIYIDGNMNNPSSMQNSEYKFVLNASVTDQEPEYTNNETGTKVEIDIPHSEVIDNTPGILIGSGTEKDPYLIESIEDLISLSNNVNSGNTYEGKYISLKQTLNFDSEDSYVDSDNTSFFGDYNGDGTVTGIKEEVTSGQGFIPIGIGVNGNSSLDKPFKGTFLGNNNAIMNIYINYEEGISNYNSSFIGLFGSVYSGIIDGVSVTGNISGKRKSTYI